MIFIRLSEALSGPSGSPKDLLKIFLKISASSPQ